MLTIRRLLLRVCILLAGFFFASLLTFLASSEAAAATEDDCLVDGGSWSGFTSDLGTCTYPEGTSSAVAACGAHATLARTYNQDETIVDVCTAIPQAAVESGPGYGGCGNEVRGPLTQARTLFLCNGKNGAVTFPIGACGLKCTITNGLPVTSNNKLPRNTEATLYVRTINPGGAGNDDSYVVCFNVNDLDTDSPALYRFVSGAWVVIAIGNANSQVLCASGAGEGAYCLAPAPKSN
jgi:hypothetical protein